MSTLVADIYDHVQTHCNIPIQQFSQAWVLMIRDIAGIGMLHVSRTPMWLKGNTQFVNL